MEKRYTLPVAIALVVGTVIGSGVFFKAEAVLTKTGGNLSVGILAFIIMGIVMIISACTFGVVAQSHEGVEGLVGYASASCGKWYSYYVGWFMAVIYYPSLVSVLSWLPARYFGVLMGWDDPVVGGRTMMLAGVFMVVTYTMNALAPKLAGKFQIATTIIKLIPLLLMAVVGTIVGLTSGMTEFNFSNVVTEMPFTEGLFGAIVSLAFAFEGWICVSHGLRRFFNVPQRLLSLPVKNWLWVFPFQHKGNGYRDLRHRSSSFTFIFDIVFRFILPLRVTRDLMNYQYRSKICLHFI